MGIEADFIVDTLRGICSLTDRMNGHNDGDHGFRCAIEEGMAAGDVSDKIREQL
jgi:hypothetical protein